MNTKITLKNSETITVSEPGQAVKILTATQFELRQLGVTLGAGQVSGLRATLAPLGTDGQPVRYAQPLLKSWTADEIAALGLAAEVEALIVKVWPVN